MKPYDHKKIEKKWRKVWDSKKIYKTLSAKQAKAKKIKPYYVLDMFPYPSGAGLHVGHPRGYIASDVVARQKRMQGFNVLHPMGFDSFGLPAEQYAIKTGKHPGPFTDTLVKQYRKQLENLGFSYDWSREVATHDPKYYKWTQWIFLQIYNSWYDTAKNKARPIDELIAIFEKSGGDGFSAKDWANYSELEKQTILMNYRLAYEGFAEVNWCPELGTVLANDEVIEKDGKLVSERGEFPVEKKAMRQWFMRITAYADRLIAGLDTIDWPENIKEIQKNWIGKSEGSELTFNIKDSTESITVFTTRADTLFGVTYVVLAPEHALIQKLQPQIKNWKAVSAYIEKLQTLSAEDRTDETKEKTGIVLEGVFAINPANGEQVPVWIADYVLASYGTGAVMAVPAHDVRDFAFAQKYTLPIKEVVRPYVVDTNNPPHPTKPFKTRNNVHAIVFNPKTQKYLILRNKKFNWDTVIIGGIEEGESALDAALREIREESGYTDVVFKRQLGNPVQAAYFAKHKDENRISISTGLYFELQSDAQVPLEQDEGNEIIWVSKADFVPGKMINAELPQWLLRLQKDVAYTDTGILVNSDKFSNISSAEAKEKITKAVDGKLVTKYKMRDAIFARQRYWGEPIPLVHKDGLISGLKENKLPLKLPKVKSYQPTGTGESPLAGVKAWVKAGYETNTMPGWAGSSWYFLRYMDPQNKKAFADQKELEYWDSVDLYVGGQEHATGHLLYSRFWHKVLKDLGHVTPEEPFKALRNQGLILATDGRKMSKRWGNVINPDDVVENYGADTMRVYEMFMGPFDQSLPWSTESIIGSRRFIERVWRLQVKIGATVATPEVDTKVHQTIDKVTKDIAGMNFNTAISALMILLNELDAQSSINLENYQILLQLLAPFAPHMTEEVWSSLGNKQSIHVSGWPVVDPKKVHAQKVTLVIQVNGKFRGQLSVEPNIDQEVVVKEAQNDPSVAKALEGKTIRKVIFVPNKIINFVV